MTDFKIIFVHGYTASPKVDWYPNVSKELQKLGVDFTVLNLPGGEYPKAFSWLELIHKEIRKTQKTIVLVGHSLGTRAILLYLDKYQQKIKYVFLIAAFANRRKNAKRDTGKYANFFKREIDLKMVKPLVEKFTVIHSKDDQCIPYQQAEEIARDLEAELTTYNNRGHFSDAENASLILKILRQKLEF